MDDGKIKMENPSTQKMEKSTNPSTPKNALLNTLIWYTHDGNSEIIANSLANKPVRLKFYTILSKNKGFLICVWESVYLREEIS